MNQRTRSFGGTGVAQYCIPADPAGVGVGLALGLTHTCTNASVRPNAAIDTGERGASDPADGQLIVRQSVNRRQHEAREPDFVGNVLMQRECRQMLVYTKSLCRMADIRLLA